MPMSHASSICRFSSSVKGTLWIIIELKLVKPVQNHFEARNGSNEKKKTNKLPLRCRRGHWNNHNCCLRQNLLQFFIIFNLFQIIPQLLDGTQVLHFPNNERIKFWKSFLILLLGEFVNVCWNGMNPSKLEYENNSDRNSKLVFFIETYKFRYQFPQQDCSLRQSADILDLIRHFQPFHGISLALKCIHRFVLWFDSTVRIHGFCKMIESTLPANKWTVC